MKVVHSNKETHRSEKEWLEQGHELETEKAWEEALKSYAKVLRLNPLNERAYERMMIIYRKERAYAKEQSLIKKGIKTFREHYKKTAKQFTGKKIVSLSKALLKSTGLANKKGDPLYEHEPIGKWGRRLAIVEKKLK